MKQHGKTYIFLVLGIIFLFVLDLATGSVELDFSTIFDSMFSPKQPSTTQSILFWEFRIPRVITASFVGMALGVGGLLMQTFFRNPIAGPYVLGIGSGSSLGVSLFIMGSYFIPSIQQSSLGMVSFGFLGALGILVLIGIFSFRFKSNVSLLIIGLMLSYFTGSIVSFLQYLSDPDLVKQYAVWGMGAFTEVHTSELWILISAIGLGLILAVSQIPFLNAFYLSDFEVETLGFSIKKNRWIVFASVALLVATSTAFCGPIAFLGMAIPHFARLLFQQSNHKYLILQSILLGWFCALGFDIISQNPWSNQMIPLNTIASFLGAPFVVFLIWKRKKI